MKKMFIAIILVTSFNSQAGLFDKKHEVYICENFSCTDKRCRDVGMQNIQIEFVTNKSKNSIFTKWYRDGKPKTNDILKNCYIVNDKNWRCEEFTDYISTISSMTDGKFEQISLSTINRKSKQVSTCSK